MDGASEQPRKRARLTGPDEDDRGLSDSAVKSETNGASTNEGGTIEDAIAAQAEQETKAGITVFAADSTVFTCIVKQRYTDFLVNEILPSGHVLHLEAAPVPQKKPKPEAALPAGQDSESKTKVEAKVAEAESSPVQEQADAKPAQDEPKKVEEEGISPEDTASLQAIFGEKTTKEMSSLYTKIQARPDRKARDFGNLASEVIDDKQARTDAHVAVRRIFKSRIETMTNDDNTIMIKAAAAPNKERNPRSLPQKSGPRVKGKVGWDELGGEHLHFTLYKENKDTMEVLYFIASQLKLHVKNFQMAGTKDRRGVTVQRVSAFRMAADRLQSMNPRLRGARLGGFEHLPKGLELGDLFGNEFKITLRDCHTPGDAGKDVATRLRAAETAIAEAMKNFQSRGFINYYGLQRFGAFQTSTDDIGKRLLKGDLEGAVDGILLFTPEALAEAQNPASTSKISYDDKARAEALHAWQTTHKMGVALDKLPRRFQAENAIIRHLGWTDRRTGELKQLKDYQGALMGIARNLRLMYVHAYQSLVWNTVAAKRWETFGLRVAEGDLILISEHAVSNGNTGSEDEVDDAGEVIVRPAVEDSAAAVDEKFERARALSKDEAESGKFSIFDLVLPLPGFDVVYPANPIGEFYKEFMASERGGGLDPYKMRRSWKDISLSGSYRKIMARPMNVAYELKTYKRDEEQMVETDLEKIERLAGRGGDRGDVKMGATDDVEGLEDKIALVVKMQLGSSQYATMALRELTKGGAVAFKPDYQGGR